MSMGMSDDDECDHGYEDDDDDGQYIVTFFHDRIISLLRHFPYVFALFASVICMHLC